MSGGYGPPAPVPIIQWEDEFEPLLGLYRTRQPVAVLEVGTHQGGSLYHWLRNAAPGSTIVSIDDYAHPEVDRRSLYPDWTPAGVTLHALAGDSHDSRTVAVAMEWAPYDWVFIDGDHSYAGVKADWENYGAMCQPGGVVCFHDITPAAGDDIAVPKLWKQLRRQYRTDQIVGGAQGGGIGIVHIP